MPETQKRTLLGILILASLLMILLGVSLPELRMRPGEIFVPPDSGQSTTVISQSFQEIGWVSTMVRGLQLMLLILLPIYIFICLLSKEGRRRLLSDVLKIAMILLLLSWISEKWAEFSQNAELSEQRLGAMDWAEIAGEGAVPAEFVARPQSWMLALLIVGVALFFAAVTFFVSRFLSRKKAGRTAYKAFAANAQTALTDIEEAKIDFDDVIIRCYAEMSQTLDAERDIQRAQAMTTSEFGQELLAKGFPAWPVEQLTQLFEQVRYGRQQPGEDRKQVAIVCLREIVDFCRRQS